MSRGVDDGRSVLRCCTRGQRQDLSGMTQCVRNVDSRFSGRRHADRRGHGLTQVPVACIVGVHWSDAEWGGSGVELG